MCSVVYSLIKELICFGLGEGNVGRIPAVESILNKFKICVKLLYPDSGTLLVGAIVFEMQIDFFFICQ